MAAGAARGRATPNSPQWADVEADNPIKPYMTAVLQGQDPGRAARTASERITAVARAALTARSGRHPLPSVPYPWHRIPRHSAFAHPLSAGRSCRIQPTTEEVREPGCRTRRSCPFRPAQESVMPASPAVVPVPLAQLPPSPLPAPASAPLAEGEQPRYVVSPRPRPGGRTRRAASAPPGVRR